jgi:mRNA-degrading endonuclease RelE of RelBE toxin-antitoxin system
MVDTAPSNPQVEDEIEIILKAEKEIPTLKKLTFEHITAYFEKILLTPSAKKRLSSVKQFPSDKELREIHFSDVVLRSPRMEKPFRYQGKIESFQKKSDWYLQMSTEFKKNIHQHNDKKFQGRVLEAITTISEHPLETKGDTVKRLSGDLEGKWRYRIGDYRLIYQPNPTSQTIALLAICPRGEAYD